MNTELSEGDLTLVHALQLLPRGSWTELAHVLGEAPATIAARWNRLRGTGAAWVMAYPFVVSEIVIALVEVDAVPGRVDDLCQRLDCDPRIATIEHAARGRDLIVTVFARDFPAMSATLLDGLARLPEVARMRSHLAVGVHIEGSHWRLDALDSSQRQALRALADRSPLGRHLDLAGPIYGPIVAELARDGRISAATLAQRLDRAPATTRRQLATLLRSGQVTFRVEIAQLLTRWPITVTWWCRVPTEAQPEVIETLRREQRTRLCLSTTGPANFLVSMWAASLPDVVTAQGILERHLSRAGEIVDTTVSLRTRKRLGWMLDPEGRATGVVHPPLPASQ